MTDRIDELQRLHEAATKGPWHADPNDIHVYAEVGPKSYTWLATCPTNMVASIGVRESDDAHMIAAARNALPALLRVARAAAEIAGNVPLDIDARIKWLELQVGREEWAELLAALAELRGTP